MMAGARPDAPPGERQRLRQDPRRDAGGAHRAALALPQRRDRQVLPPSYEAIAEAAGCARSTVYEAIRALEQVGQFRHFTGSMNFGTPPGDREQARTADHPANRRAQCSPRTRARKFASKSNGWDENRVFLEGDSFRTGSRTGAGAEPPACGPAAGGGTAPMLFYGRLKRRCNGGDVVTETALHVVTPSPWPIERRAYR